ncbi:TPA: hypothetical protein ACGUPU_002851 [Vibrio vulnificus]
MIKTISLSLLLLLSNSAFANTIYCILDKTSDDSHLADTAAFEVNLTNKTITIKPNYGVESLHGEVTSSRGSVYGYRLNAVVDMSNSVDGNKRHKEISIFAPEADVTKALINEATFEEIEGTEYLLSSAKHEYSCRIIKK